MTRSRLVWQTLANLIHRFKTNNNTNRLYLHLHLLCACCYSQKGVEIRESIDHLRMTEGGCLRPPAELISPLRVITSAVFVVCFWWKRGVQVSLFEEPRWLDCQLVESGKCCTARISLAPSSSSAYLPTCLLWRTLRNLSSYPTSKLKPCSNISPFCRASRSAPSLTDSMSHPKQSIRNNL